MKVFGAFILFVTAFLVLGTILRDDIAPRLPDEGLILISGLAAAALVWIWHRISNPPAPEAAPPTLEDLERAVAGASALVWEAAPASAVAKDSPAATGKAAPGQTAFAKNGPWGSTSKAPAHAGSADGPSPEAHPNAPVGPADATPPSDTGGRGRKGVMKGGWVPAEVGAQVQGRAIGGLVYVGTPPRLRDRGGAPARGWIDPGLSVARQARDPLGAEMPYWPNYATLSPTNRATYLDWLAGGRDDREYGIGYMFLYLYGLERRLLLDHPPAEERAAILDETLRLLAVYGDNGSARRYLTGFADLARAMTFEPALNEPAPTSLSDRHWEVPLVLRYAIGGHVLRDAPLSAGWLLAWFATHPEANLLTPARRCEPEFRALFQAIFDQRFPEGLTLRKPRKALETSYRAASGDFDVSFRPQIGGKTVPDVSGLRKPIEIAQEIADEACARLDRYSRYLGRNPDGRGTLEAQGLLPPELAAAFPSDALDALVAWVTERVDAGGLVKVDELLLRLEGEVPQRVGRRQIEDAAEVLRRIGFGLVPDPAHGLRGPKIGEPVVIYALDHVSEPETPSPGFQEALLQLALGVIVARADQAVGPEERAALARRIDEHPGMSAAERLRLRADLVWMIAVPPDVTALRSRLGQVSPQTRAELRTALVAAAVSDGHANAAEVAQIERIYRIMGLEPGQVYSDLHSGGIIDGPVTLRREEPGPAGQPIPPQAKPARPVLDAARIAAIRADTDQVSQVLSAIFGAEPEPPPPAPAVPAGQAVLDGLDPRQTALLRDILGAERWSEDAFAALAQRHGLMAGGAVEALNEWAFDRYDEALLDLDLDYDVSPTIAADLAPKLQPPETQPEE